MGQDSAFSAGIARHARANWSPNSATVELEDSQAAFRTGIVMDDHDDALMGRLWVNLNNYSPPLLTFPASADGPDREEQKTGWILCYPMFPFFGSDSFRGGALEESKTPGGRRPQNGESNSYGFFYQPRIGDYVGVLFANNDPGHAFWVGCIPKIYENFMVPGAPAVAEPDDTGKTEYVPSHEAYMTVDGDVSNADPDGEDKRNAALTFRDNLRHAGLHRDPVRGAGSSNGQRESPSYVMGMKSAGWVYDIEKNQQISSDNDSPFSSDTGKYQKFNEMGHQLVLDDHPDSQLVRIRTSKGAQILFNDTEGYLYINSYGGNVWLEITDAGQVNVYSQDSISFHTKKDYNVTADGNYNLQVDGNWNVQVKGNTVQNLLGAVTILTGATNKDALKIVSNGDTHFRVEQKRDDYIKNDYNLKSDGNWLAESAEDTKFHIGGNWRSEATEDQRHKSGTNTLITSGGIIGIKADGTMLLTAAEIFENGPTAPSAVSVDGAETATAGEAPPLAMTYGPPTEVQILSGDPPDQLPYLAPVVPQHEPWPPHTSPATGFQGTVQPNPDVAATVRRGATTRTAPRPDPVTGSVRGTPGNYRGNNYSSNNLGESPSYTRTGPVPDGAMAPANSYTISEAGKNLIKRFEAYKGCPYVGPEGYGFTVGYGHFMKVGEQIGDLKVTQELMDQLARSPKNTCGILNLTREQADAFFDIDVVKYEKPVRRLITHVITQGQYDALVRLTYNIGEGGLQGSSVRSDINAGNFEAVPEHWMLWNKAGRPPRELSGLTTRRRAELAQLWGAPVS